MATTKKKKAKEVTKSEVFGEFYVKKIFSSGEVDVEVGLLGRSYTTGFDSKYTTRKFLQEYIDELEKVVKSLKAELSKFEEE